MPKPVRAWPGFRDTNAWQRAADALARSFAPTVIPCERCGYPSMVGYVCHHCKAGDPKAERRVIPYVKRMRKEPTHAQEPVPES